MKWAPVAPMGLDDTPQPKYLHKEGSTVKVKFGHERAMVEYELPEPVDFAVLAWFKQREHVVAVCKDMVHAFDLAAGRNPATIGLSFKPSSVLGSRDGLVLGQDHDKFYLLTDPYVLLGKIVSSSLDSITGEMLHFGDGMALLYRDQAVDLYTMRVLPPPKGLSSRAAGNASAASTRGHNSVSRRSLLSGISGVTPDVDASMASFASSAGRRNDVVTHQSHSHILRPTEKLLAAGQRAALLTRIASISVDVSSASDLETVVQTRAGEFAVAIRNKASDSLFVFSSAGGGETFEIENVKSIAPLRGFVDGRYPMVVTDRKIWSLFFRDLEPLTIPLDPQVFASAVDSDAVTVLVDKDSVSGNAFTFHVSGLSTHQRLLLVAVDGGIISDCLRLLEVAHGPARVAEVLVEVSASLHEFDGLLEDRSRRALCRLVETNPQLFGSQFFVYLRMLQSEYSLGALEQIEYSFLSGLIARYEDTKGEPTQNIYEVLESRLNGSVLQYTMPPFVPGTKDLFWRTRALLAFFDLLADQPFLESMRALFDKYDLVENLKNFAPGIRMILREVAAYIAYTPLSTRSVAATPRNDSETVSLWLFNKDKRFEEAQFLLQNTQPRQISVKQPVGISEHAWAQKQESLAYYYGEMVYARSFGRAALEIGSADPSAVVSMKAPDVNFGVDIHNLGLSLKPAVFESRWGEFAHGTATGLSFRPADSTSNLLKTWSFSRASNVDAGMLYGLGLMGHLEKLEEWHIYKFLEAKSPLLSTGVLLGLAASRKGSMDAKITKVLSVHISALLPAGAHDLQVAPEVQNAAIIALGLLYFKTGHRRMSEMLLKALNDDGKDEEYKLAAGIALGLVRSLGSQEGLTTEIRDRLLALAARPRDRYTTQISSEVDDPMASAAGATTALLLMYTGTNNRVVADHLESPPSKEAAEYMRPDLMFPRALARTLIMWDSVDKAEEWARNYITSQLEAEETGLWSQSNLVGVLVGIALRHAATNDESVISLLLACSDHFTKLVTALSDSYEHSVWATVAWKSNCTLLLAAAAVAAGSGNLDVLRRLRARLRPRPWGSFQSATSNQCKNGDYGPLALGIGWLFMGGGQWSFKTDPESIAVLALAFVPMLGGSGIDAENWEHIRHLWVLSAEKRCLVVRDNSQGGKLLEGVKVGVELVSTGETKVLTSPALLPTMADVASVAVADPRYLQLKTEWSRDLALDVRPQKQSGSIGEMLEIRNVATGDADHDFAAMNSIASFPSTCYEEWSLRLLFTFCDSWLPNAELLSVPRREIEYLKARKWIQTRDQKTT